MNQQQAQLLNWLADQNKQLAARVAQLEADVKMVGDIAVDLHLVAVAKGGPLAQQVEQIILKGTEHNGS